MPSYMPDVWIISLVIRLLPWCVGEEEVWRECWFASVTASILIHFFSLWNVLRSPIRACCCHLFFLLHFQMGQGSKFLKSYSRGLAAIPTLVAQSLRAVAQYTPVMCASLMHKWMCPQRMDIYDTFAKTLRPFSRHTPSTAIMFPTVEETNAFAGYLLLVFGLNFICSSWPIGTPFTSQSLRGSLKETKQNTFVTSNVLHVRASLYMSKLPEDQIGSQTPCVHIEHLVIIVLHTRRCTRFWLLCGIGGNA